jgi:hypothetical protein
VRLAPDVAEALSIRVAPASTRGWDTGRTSILGRFPGKSRGVSAELRVYPSHLELTVELPGDLVTVVIDMDDVGSVLVEEVLGISVLGIEDLSGEMHGFVLLDPPAAERAKALIDRARANWNT